MKVKIDDNLYLESDEHQYILKKYTGTYSTRNKGKDDEHQVENFRVLGYFRTVSQAVNKLISNEIKTSTASNLKELREDIQAIKKWVESKLEGY